MKTTTLLVTDLERSVVVDAHSPDHVSGEALPTANNPSHVHP
jgi:hypothetical protein